MRGAAGGTVDVFGQFESQIQQRSDFFSSGLAAKPTNQPDMSDQKSGTPLKFAWPNSQNTNGSGLTHLLKQFRFHSNSFPSSFMQSKWKGACGWCSWVKTCPFLRLKVGAYRKVLVFWAFKVGKSWSSITVKCIWVSALLSVYYLLAGSTTETLTWNASQAIFWACAHLDFSWNQEYWPHQSQTPKSRPKLTQIDYCTLLQTWIQKHLYFHTIWAALRDGTDNAPSHRHSHGAPLFSRDPCSDHCTKRW